MWFKQTKCFQYALTAAVNHQNIKSHSERISNLKPFIDQCNCKEINFPPHPSKDWKKFELNNKTIGLKVACMVRKKLFFLWTDFIIIW